MIENRQSFRLRQQIDLDWSVTDQKTEGKGTAFNVSKTGMLFETDRLFSPEHGMTLSLKCEETPTLPQKGKLVWFRKVGENKAHYLCGIRFNSDDASNVKWVKWMEESFSKLADVGNTTILTRYLQAGDNEGIIF